MDCTNNPENDEIIKKREIEAFLDKSATVRDCVNLINATLDLIGIEIIEDVGALDVTSEE